MTELTANLKTRCVGRYLVDMPEDATEYGYARIGGVDIEAKAMTEDAWRQEVAQREAALKATKSRDAYPFLYAAGKARGEDTYYFIHRGTIYEAPNRRYIEGYKWDRGYRFLLKVKTYDYTNPDRSSDPIVKQFDVKNEVPAKTSLVFDLLEKLQGRRNEEIPTAPGTCFAGGFLPGKATDGQYVRGGFTLTSNPDVSFVISLDTASQGGMTLLQHAGDSQTLDALKAMDAKVIRKGSVELSGLKAEEWLFEGLKPGDGRGETFTLSVNDTTSGPSSPYLSLEMDTGGQLEIQGKFVKLDKGSLTTGEAIALWDAVSRKVRVRPGAF
ncbi:T6SS immunity protein Tli4 family protein [Paraburkholderia flagellata]|uniref:T6SS immunity protein Tli4 family protein n=1 Tax=Paraburkholderia flagellata TaxID=2883241 RepID=UPI001EEC22DB|nr:T6SS immunity protein Tli4 family protein [Paraburkholderia flagellata]